MAKSNFKKGFSIDDLTNVGDNPDDLDFSLESTIFSKKRDHEFDEFLNELINIKCKINKNGKISNPINCKNCTVGTEFQDIKSILKNFLERNQRIPYHIITIKLFDSDDETYEILYNTLDGMIEYLQSMGGDDKEIITELFRIRDHVELANTQSREIKRARDNVKKELKKETELLGVEVKKAKKSFKKIKTKTKKIKSKIEDISKELIGIVSIFVAIAFVMFGGINLINNLFSSIGNQNQIISICFGSLFGLVIVESLYYFSVLVLKLSGLSQESGDQGRTMAQRSEKYLLWIFVITGILSFMGIQNIGDLSIIGRVFPKILNHLLYFLCIFAISFVIIWLIIGIINLLKSQIKK